MAVLGSNRALFYDPVDGGYQARHFVQDTLTHDDTNHLFVLTQTSGVQIRFQDFSSFVDPAQQGQFISLTDQTGNVTSVTDENVDGTIAEIQRTDSATGLTESYLYSYVGSGPNAGLLDNVTLRRSSDGGTTWDEVRQSAYTYYDGTQSYGNAGDLMTSIVENADGAIDTNYFRYYTAADAGTTGYVHGLKYMFSPASYARLVSAVGDPTTATDEDVAPYADAFYQYDSQQRVTQAVLQGAGCSCVAEGGKGTYTYSYETSSNSAGFNSWRTKTTVVMPDESIDTYYMNPYGELILKVHEDPDTAQEVEWFTKYDGQGRIVLQANPSAITGFDEGAADLLNSQAGNYEFLSDDAGLIATFSYATTTTATESSAGAAAGYLESTSIQRGELGTPVLRSSTTYFVHTGGGSTIFPTATTTVYRNDGIAPVPDDAGFETPNVGTGSFGDFEYNPTGAPWLYVNGAGVAGNGSGFTSGNPDAPDGTQVAFLQGAGSSISQSIYFVAGDYTVSFMAAQRGNYQPDGSQTVEVLVDGNVVGTFTPAGTSYVLETTGSFTVTTGAHTLTFEGINTGDTTAFIDQVTLQQDLGAETTSVSYTFFTDSTRVQSMATSLPVVSAAQNGPGTADVSDAVMNQDGRLIWTRDADGFINYFAYDEATGALVKMITDVDTTQAGDFADLPSGWTTPAGGGLHLVSTMEVDNLGRTTLYVTPRGTKTFSTYHDPAHEKRVYRGWDSATNMPTGPTEVYREDRPGSYFETLTMSAAPDVDGDGRPMGTEAISDIQTLSRTYISAGGQVDHVDKYFFITGGAAVDAGFETPNVGTGSYYDFQYGPTGTAWICNGGSGVAGNGSGFTSGNPNAPEGTQVGFLQSVGSSISQSIAFAAGTYTIEFLAAQRQNYQPGGDQVIKVQVDGAEVGTITPSSTSYASYSSDSFELTAGVHTIAFVGQTSGDSTAFIDEVNIAGDTNSLTYSTDANIGTINVNYYRTVYGHDDRGRTDRAETPNGTIYRTVYDSLGRVISTWVGTNDTPVSGDWAPDNNDGTANMVQTMAYVYDGGGVGDSNLTQITQFPGGDEPDRVSRTFYDWRDRAVASKSGVQTTEDTTTHRPIFYTEYDNLSEIIASEQYDGDGVSIGDVNMDAVPDKPAASLLRARQMSEFDDQGRGFRSHVYSVDQTNGVISNNSLTSNMFFDHRGDLIESAMPGGLVSKSQFDGAERLVVSFTTDRGGDSGWPDANNVADDAVLEHVEYTYDANSNTILTTVRQRFHDETATGELGDATTGPLARVSYAAAYYDLGDRLTDNVNVGTNGGTAYTRPSSVPARSDTVLVSSLVYNAAGWVSDTIDPRGIDSHTDYDALGRSVRTIQAFVDGIPSSGDDRTTAYVFDGNNNTLSVTTVLPDGAHQTTAYVYGMTTDTGSGVNSNDVLTATQFPDTTTGDPSSSEQETYTVNALRQRLTFTDRNGSTHTYGYDVLGRPVSDAVTTLGDGVDGSVRRIETAYDTADRPFLFTSYDAASGGNVVNQVLREFNGLGQMTAEYQEHGGAVNTSTSPKVQYTFSEMSGGDNHSRLTSIVYPNGRVLDYNYASGIDDSISRLSSISDNSGTLEAYDYLGLGTVVRRYHPETGIDETFIKLASESNGDAGDQYTGLDCFGRIVEEAWRNASGTAVTDDFFYGYDRDSNRTFKDNGLNSALDEAYSYDLFNQLTDFSRSDGHSQDWNLDGIGNWSSVTTDGDTQTRDLNAQNEYTSILGAATPTYDANGSMTTDETGKTFMYDAWNRLVEVKDFSSTTIATYTLDTLGRRVTEDVAGTQRDMFFDTVGQVLEEQVAGQTEIQYTWCPYSVNQLLARDRDTNGDGSLDERLYVVQDANLNVTSLVDTAGNVVERFINDPYGQVSVLDASWNVQSSSLYSWRYLFQGGRFEGVTGLYKFGARDYSPTLGRWMEMDPIGFSGGSWVLYQFVSDNPINATDPTGLGNAKVHYACFSPDLSGFCFGSCTCFNTGLPSFTIKILMLSQSEICCTATCLFCPGNPAHANGMQKCMNLGMNVTTRTMGILAPTVCFCT